jgi:hypothetical protein
MHVISSADPDAAAVTLPSPAGFDLLRKRILLAS